MHQEFKDLYQKLYEEFSAFRWPYPAVLQPVFDLLTTEQVWTMVDDTRKAIDDAEANESVKLRSDAKYFLLLNFVEMVLLPISIVREKGLYEPGAKIVTEGQMREDLKTDIGQIIKEAINKRDTEVEALPWNERDKQEYREITGHNVIDAISEAWEKIKYNEYLYWASR
jgi:hypothetical protein